MPVTLYVPSGIALYPILIHDHELKPDLSKHQRNGALDELSDYTQATPHTAIHANTSMFDILRYFSQNRTFPFPDFLSSIRSLPFNLGTLSIELHRNGFHPRVSAGIERPHMDGVRTRL
ncbi:MAG: hypothetical protein BWY82_00624 [Verrucomicrobia bacterium ADurb.Bin474]|nr:MAG: hypothetical protein BWY82_00624 [Verrucomicrobia bacterium ADurb.Bin474]